MALMPPVFPPPTIAYYPTVTLIQQSAAIAARPSFMVAGVRSPFVLTPTVPWQAPQKAFLTLADLPHIPQADALIVLAHPDDEIFLSATAAQLAREGKSVQFAYVTNGSAGEDVSGRGLTGHVLGAERSLEAARAVSSLGITRPPLILDFQDGEIAGAPDALSSQLRSILTQIRPKTVFLYNPENGITGHPDHQNVSRTMDSILDTIATGRTPQDRLDRSHLSSLIQNSAVYHASLSQTALDRFRQFFSKDNPSWQGLKAVPDQAIQMKVAVPQSFASQKFASHKQHRSQYKVQDFDGVAGFYRSYPYEEFTKYQIKTGKFSTKP